MYGNVYRWKIPSLENVVNYRKDNRASTQFLCSLSGLSCIVYCVVMMTKKESQLLCWSKLINDNIGSEGKTWAPFLSTVFTMENKSVSIDLSGFLFTADCQ